MVVPGAGRDAMAVVMVMVGRDVGNDWQCCLY